MCVGINNIGYTIFILFCKYNVCISIYFRLIGNTSNVNNFISKNSFTQKELTLFSSYTIVQNNVNIYIYIYIYIYIPVILC